ncbi:MAG: hypothetical protein R3A51_13565 [Nannocystaceae bacterium]|nr:hypothetical protein [Myxococcales bacterium]
MHRHNYKLMTLAAALACVGALTTACDMQTIKDAVGIDDLCTNDHDGCDPPPPPPTADVPLTGKG